MEARTLNRGRHFTLADYAQTPWNSTRFDLLPAVDGRLTFRDFDVVYFFCFKHIWIFLAPIPLHRKSNTMSQSIYINKEQRYDN